MYKNSFNVISAFILTLSILMPTLLIELKFCLLILALCLALGMHLQGQANLSPQFIYLSIFYAAVGSLWSLYGLFRGNPGAINVINVMVIYPIIFTFMSSIYKNGSDESKIEMLFIFLSASIFIMNLIYIYGFIYHPGNSFQVLIERMYGDEVSLDVDNEYFKFTIPNISSAIFLLPFLISRLAYSKSNRLLLVVSSFGLIILMFISGRRGFFLSFIVGIILSYLLTSGGDRKKSYEKINSGLIWFLAAITLSVSLVVFDSAEVDFYLDQLKSIFNFYDNQSNIIRKEQFFSLVSGIFENPLFGAGAGAAAQYQASPVQPWAYELSYVAFLFHHGIIGALIYVMGVVYIISNLAKIVRKNGRDSFEFSVLAGFVSFLTANATNPYLAKFDYMWAFFIPVAILNSYSFRNRVVVRFNYG